MNRVNLNEFSVFGRMTSAEVERIESLCEEVTYQDGHTIFKEGDRSSYLYLLKSGRVSLRISLPNHKVLVVGTVEPGETLGWSSVRRDKPYTAMAVAVGDVEMIRISGEKLAKMFETEPRIGYLAYASLLGVVAERLEEARIRIANLENS